MFRNGLRTWQGEALGCVVAVAAILVWAPPAHAGDGSFPDSLSAAFATGDSPEPVAVGDFNNDGHQDLVAGNFTPAASSLTVRLGDGAGGFSTEAPGSPVAAGGQPSSIAVGDFNVDGDEDLAVANANGNGNLKIFIGNGTGAFAATSTYNANTGMSRVAVGDFNGDGYDDLVVAGFLTSKVYVRLGNGLGAFTNPATETAVDNPTAVAVGNFNGDAYEDFAATSLSGGVHVRLSNGNGSFSTPTGSPFSAGTQPYSIAVGDYNDDAHDDLAIVGSSSTDLTIETGNGAGGFTPHVAGPPLPTGEAFVSVGDFNGDYNDDLVISGQNSGTTVRLGDGTGEFPTEPPGSPYASGLENAVGDFDGDGVGDLAVSDPAHDAITVRRGAGPSPNAGNLLVNGNAETDPGGAARTPTATPEVPGWVNLGNHTYVRYSTVGGSTGGFPRWPASARWNGGENFISGGQGGQTDYSLRQGFYVSTDAAAIDAGRVTVDFSADLGGYLSDNDHVDASMWFVDGNGQFIGEPVVLPSVTAAERGNRTVLIHRAVSVPMPVGTRFIGVILNQVHVTGTYQNGYADNVRVALHVAPEPEPPPPGGGGDTAPPQTTILKEPDNHTEKAKVTYKFRSSEPNSTFDCKFDDGKYRPCDSGKVKYKHLDFGKHSFHVRAIDPAGNTDPTPAKDKFKRKQ
jgi:hypothetical protein